MWHPYELKDAANKGMIVSERKENQSEDKSLSTAIETVNEGEQVTVEFTNRKEKYDVKVTKVVDMTYGNVSYAEYSNQSFTFGGILTNLTPSTKYSVVITDKNTAVFSGESDDTAGNVQNLVALKEQSFTSDRNGNAQFSVKLKHNETFTIKGLPIDATYKITESGAENYISSYKVSGISGAVIASSSGSAGGVKEALSTAVERVDAGETEVEITFTNRYVFNYVLPAAGMEDQRGIMAVIFSGMILFAAAYLFISRKKSDKRL